MTSDSRRKRIATFLILGIFFWILGDRANYNWLLVFIGWIFIIGAGYSYFKK